MNAGANVSVYKNGFVAKIVLLHRQEHYLPKHHGIWNLLEDHVDLTIRCRPYYTFC